jgi:hypothetical protein
MIQYVINNIWDSETDEEREFITVFSEYLDSPIVAQSNHPNYINIVALAKDGSSSYEDEIAAEIEELAKIEISVANKFQKVTDRVSVANGQVYFDGDILHNAITNHILRYLEGGYNFEHLALFLEKLYQNPNAHSRQQLYEWLDARDFSITEDGDIYAYKGLTDNGKSIHSGGAIVNGERVKGQVPNNVGSTIELPRSEVQFDPSIGCGVGLHVGTYDYASSFARGTIAGVIVNPRDIVSVPTDSGAQKVRTCRYKVVDIIEEAYNDPFYEIDDANDDVIDYDYEPDKGIPNSDDYFGQLSS